MTITPAPPAEPAALKCQCAELWSHPAAQLLVGPSLHPGGVAGTERLLDLLHLPSDAVVVDVGCGGGTTLETLSGRGLRGVGIDYSHELAAATGVSSPATVGDAEHLPLRDGAADAVLLECVVSVFPDKRAALTEARRVLPVGGRLALSDMTLAASFPEPLNTALAWVACAAGALDADGYRRLLHDTGFRVTHLEDRSGDLADMVATARRRLALFHGASAIGLLPTLAEFLGPDLAELGRALLGGDDLVEASRITMAQVTDAIHRGEMGYVAFTAMAV